MNRQDSSTEGAKYLIRFCDFCASLRPNLLVVGSIWPRLHFSLIGSRPFSIHVDALEYSDRVARRNQDRENTEIQSEVTEGFLRDLLFTSVASVAQDWVYLNRNCSRRSARMRIRLLRGLLHLLAGLTKT